jgi:hypothetical protein
MRDNERMTMKGYHNDRVSQAFDTVGSRRQLLYAVVIGVPALLLASVSGALRAGSAPAGAVDAATVRDGDLPALASTAETGEEIAGLAPDGDVADA